MNITRTQRMMELSFPSELGYEVVARDSVAAFARCIGLSRARIEDLKTALSEACINAIEHGNSLKPGLRVQVFCMVEPGKLVIEVCDHGIQCYMPGKEPLSIAEKLAGLGPLRGMGLMLISELSDEAGFVSDSTGNRFRLVFRHQPSSVSPEKASTDSRG
jgi:serine/threonine-protein kinase RsbW